MHPGTPFSKSHASQNPANDVEANVTSKRKSSICCQIFQETTLYPIGLATRSYLRTGINSDAAREAVSQRTTMIDKHLGSGVLVAELGSGIPPHSVRHQLHWTMIQHWETGKPWMIQSDYPPSRAFKASSEGLVVDTLIQTWSTSIQSYVPPSPTRGDRA